MYDAILNKKGKYTKIYQNIWGRSGKKTQLHGLEQISEFGVRWQKMGHCYYKHFLLCLLYLRKWFLNQPPRGIKSIRQFMNAGLSSLISYIQNHYVLTHSQDLPLLMLFLPQKEENKLSNKQPKISLDFLVAEILASKIYKHFYIQNEFFPIKMLRNILTCLNASLMF